MQEDSRQVNNESREQESKKKEEQSKDEETKLSFDEKNEKTKEEDYDNTDIYILYICIYNNFTRGERNSKECKKENSQ
jgi:hypothetical protein